MPRRYCIRALVGEDGFEPSKRNATDLQSAPFGHSGTLPYEIGAGGRIRTPDLLITNQLLYQLSYTSLFATTSGARYNIPQLFPFGKGFLQKKFEKIF